MLDLPPTTLEQELLAALLAVLDLRQPGIAHQMMVVLDTEPMIFPDNVIPLRPARSTQLQAFAWTERAARLLDGARAARMEGGGAA